MRFATPVLALLAAGLLTSAAHAAVATPAAARAEAPPGSEDMTLARGKYLTDAGNCISCHTRPGAAPYSGGVAFVTGLGTLYSSNITPDRDTGIGDWSDADFRRAMHEGIARGGERLFPAFPYTSFTRVSDADVDAIRAYLRTLQPVRYVPPANSWLLRQRWGMRFWNLLFFRSGRFQPDPKQSADWNRGAYLVDGLGHCDACHSPRNLFMAEINARAYAGGTLQEKVPGGRIRRWSAVNLTSASTGLASWSVSDLSKYLKSGFSLRAGVFGPMNDVIDNSLRQLSTDDVHAMAVYLKSLPPRQSSGAPVEQAQMQAGARLYSVHCQECHMSSGRGGLFSAPPLQGSAVVQAQDPASLINVILYGADAPRDVSFGGWQTMKPYREVLTDAETAALANYVRGSWKNRAGAVTAGDVARQR